jgi:ActR/RegA family two-component response regulator
MGVSAALQRHCSGDARLLRADASAVQSQLGIDLSANSPILEHAGKKGARVTQADFSYGAAEDKATARSLSIFADRPYLREQLREDAEAAGFEVRRAGPLAQLLDSAHLSLGEAAVIDCPLDDAHSLAALARVDREAGLTGAQLVISTGIGALDQVFASFERSEPQILVDPSHADRIIALGRVLASGGPGRVREMSNQDQLMLLRLTEQVGQIAARLEAFGAGAVAGGAIAGLSGTPAESGSRTESPAIDFAGTADPGTDRLVRTTRPPLPDARLVRQIIRQRQMRSRFLDGNLFADPAWDILLDLTASRVEHVRVSVSSLCIAAGVPPTTALRWITQMTEAGLLERVEDEADRRRAFIGLTEKTADAIARYFAEIGRGAAHLV